MHKHVEGNRNDTKPLAMNFFRRFKDYVLGEVSRYLIIPQVSPIPGTLKLQIAVQDLKPTSEGLSEPSSSSTASAGFVQKVAVKQTVQPVGYSVHYEESNGGATEGQISYSMVPGDGGLVSGQGISDERYSDCRTGYDRYFAS